MSITGYSVMTSSQNPRWWTYGRYVSILILVKNDQIMMKSGTLNQIVTDQNDLTKIQICKFRMAEDAILENIFFGHNSAAGCPTFAEVCTYM